MILQSEEEEEKSVAYVSAILFFVLSLQTGVTSLDGEKRFHQLCKNLCLLLSGMARYTHTVHSTQYTRHPA